MSSAPKILPGQRGKPTFELVEPGGRSRSEVHMKARMTCKPVPDRGCTVRAVVVRHQMDVQSARNTGAEGAQEQHKFAAARRSVQLSDQFPDGNIQCREQGSCVMAHVGTPLGNARCEGQHAWDPPPGSGSFHPRTAPSP